MRQELTGMIAESLVDKLHSKELEQKKLSVSSVDGN